MLSYGACFAVGSENKPLGPKSRYIMMATMKNKVQLIGNLGNDPELKEIGKGQHMVRINLATNERYKGTDGEWKEITQWHPITAWGKQAERLAELTRKGTGLVVEGRLVHRSWETASGEKRYSTEVALSEFHLLANTTGKGWDDDASVTKNKGTLASQA